MRVLVTNDDGIDSPGLAVLASAAVDAGCDVVVAAPARESSGASASLLGAEQDGRLIVDEKDAPGLPPGVSGSFAVRAAPALIALVASHGGFGPKPDLVLSGVNRGGNTGHAVIHSGTVGAALSAMTHGIRGMAVSIADDDPRHWETAGVVVRPLLDWLLASEPLDRVVNVNVPDRPAHQVRGVRQAPLASFGTVHARIREVDHGNLVLTYSEVEVNREMDTDAGLLARGWATVTLLRAPVHDADAAVPELLHGL
ncbi:5'/3'-nucleotidase SurE [Cellulomonas fimi]|uniref:5'-nucleotidase n=1 Tax=Cellulomonas fimi TaxID=1708 RepID=A0A7Y0LWV4_CELFI|nr:5'/3'-nucleotidase SurE [Cellulomonas fimi]NMR19721.1 5'/3'-nucleotidase SurE [Cellulomonas fimi]